MIVVVEGPDNSGKSTLAHRLAKDLKAMLVKSEVRPVTQDVLISFVQWLKDTEDAFKIVVCDRHHAVGEPIYGRVLRNRVLVDTWYASVALAEVDVIYCRRPLSELLKFPSHIQQLPGVKSNIERIYDEYEVLFNPRNRRLFRNLATYNYDWDDYDILLSKVRGMK